MNKPLKILICYRTATMFHSVTATNTNGRMDEQCLKEIYELLTKKCGKGNFAVLSLTKLDPGPDELKPLSEYQVT